MERLLAVYEAVRDVDELVNAGERGLAGSVSDAVSTSMLVQVNTLVDLRYLSRDGGGDLITEPRFTCNVSHGQAAELAGIVGVQLEQFLHQDPAAA